jgi:hypothetical protein
MKGYNKLLNELGYPIEQLDVIISKVHETNIPLKK